MGEVVSTPRGEFFVEKRGPSQGMVPLIIVAGLGDDHSS
jgi:hypothetical protein